MKYFKENKYWKNIFAIFIALLLLCVLSNSQVKKINPELHHKDFLKLVKNACVSKNAMDDMHFCFKNGKYKKDTQHIIIELLNPIIFAHFNSDSLEYAIAPMSYDGGGNHIFYLILVFVCQHNKAIQVSYGDVLEEGMMHDIRVSRDTIMVDLLFDDTINTEKLLFKPNHLINSCYA